MLVLGIDSSTDFVSMGIAEDQKLLGEISFPFTRETLKKWIYWLDFFLQECKIELEKIDALACVCGPGTFSNLRLGLSSFKGIAFALKKPIVSFSSLDIYAERISLKKVRVLIPSTQGSFFYSIYENKNRLFDPLIGTIEEMLANVCQEEIWVGPNTPALRSLVLPKNISMIFFAPSGSFIASLGVKKAFFREFIDPISLKIDYIRGARAQEKK